jgi:hypothetical protein
MVRKLDEMVFHGRSYLAQPQFLRGLVDGTEKLVRQTPQHLPVCDNSRSREATELQQVWGQATEHLLILRKVAGLYPAPLACQ